ncbi:MAG TPA: hypothetical protein PKM99_07725 [Thermotogota bacterium]|jgi:nicotinate-nucleotide pyrophosphorylase|nr:hypothetical protein [Thermotogota bacterium]NLZ13673.1 hypothetical protein [Thermotogaceae bacterium]HNR63933.1 hypothetical protein [Thermotogota bacterium]HNT95986.1 hypothetical protein [Thermotogota bacterium]HOZ12585.1 hypothetical protein [Thermotogota bacterium]
MSLFAGKKIFQPMEEWPAYEREWMAKVSNKGPILFTGEGFLSQISKDYSLEVNTSFRRGDFVANETGLMTLRGKLGALIRFRDEFLYVYTQTLHLSTMLYRLKETVKRVNPLASVIIRSLPPVKPLDDWYFEAIEDASCICWPSSVTDGVVHQEIWKEYGGIEKTIEFYRRAWNPSFKLLFECDRLSDGITAIKSGADGIVLKDLKSEMVGEIVKALRERFKKIYLEYCGDITLQNVDQYASLGLDALSTYRIDLPKASTLSEMVYTLIPAPDTDEPEQS